MHTSPFSRLGVLLIGLLAVGGCKQPADVELASDAEGEDLELHAVAVADPDVATSPIDSSAVLPSDQMKYDGLFVVNAVTWDAGSVVRKVAYSKVIVTDSIARVLDRRVGVRGRDLGVLTLNGSTLIKVPHRIPVNRIFGRDTSIVFGVEYLMDLTQGYQANHTYTWTITPIQGAARSVSIETPESLSVIAPRGGTVLARNRNAQIRWSGGKGKLSIIVSRYDPVLRQVTPLMELRAPSNTGRATLPVKLMAMLPAHRYFILTFVLANRKDLEISQPVGGTALVQAASVYNSFIEVQ